MMSDSRDLDLLQALRRGLAFTERPYAKLGARIGMDEAETIRRLKTLCDAGTISRFGLVVRHHELGVRANAMTVWDVPDDHVSDAGSTLAALDYVRLCYVRPRRPPAWPYNLYAMIHGTAATVVERQVEEATQAAGLEGLPRAVLFSKRRFKQTGAWLGAERQL